jgi:hypothetical protein
MNKMTQEQIEQYLFTGFLNQPNVKLSVTIKDMHVVMEKRGEWDLVVWQLERVGEGSGAVDRFFTLIAHLIPNNMKLISIEDVLSPNLTEKLQREGWKRGTLVPRSNREIAKLLCPDVDELSFYLPVQTFKELYGSSTYSRECTVHGNKWTDV